MRWRTFFLFLAIVLAARIVASLFSADFWFGKQDTPVNTDIVAPQEPDIRIENLPEEHRAVEPEQEPAQAGPEPAEMEVPESSLIAGVPFTVQAPFGEWDDPISQNGCEEASLVMAEHWLSGKTLTKEIVKREIAALASYEKKRLGHSIDTSAEDTLKLFQDYYDIAAGEVRTDIGLADIGEALAAGSIVIVPADGRKLQNPYFTQPGPTTHMLVIFGYDAKTREFIVNDPGTRHGAGYRYDEDILYGAILDYPTGDHLPIRSVRKSMIVIGKL